MVYAKFGGQTECIMGNWKIENSDDGSHFKHNKIPHKMTYGLVSVQWWPLSTGKNNKERQT